MFSTAAAIALTLSLNQCSIYVVYIQSSTLILCHSISLFDSLFVLVLFYVLIISLSLLNGCRFSFSRLFIKCRIKVLQAFFIFHQVAIFTPRKAQTDYSVCMIYKCIWVDSRVSTIKEIKNKLKYFIILRQKYISYSPAAIQVPLSKGFF